MLRSGSILLHRPEEREWTSWLIVGVWSGAIFLSIPFVRPIVRLVDETWNREIFNYISLGIGIIIIICILIYVFKYNNEVKKLIIVSCFGAIYLYLIATSGAPEESIHYLLYSGLGVLIYRAFLHRVRDCSIYIAAAFVGAFIGIVDEIIQWIVPKRYFDIRDIAFNVTGVAFAQLVLATVVRPRIVSGWPDSTGWRRLCLLGALVTSVVALCHLNTPQAIAVYTERVSALQFIRDSDDVMFEYGYLYDDPDAGRFKSRLSRKELEGLNKARGERGARILDRFRGRNRYREFLRIYTALKDPFLHEARVHLFSRDVHLARAETSTDPRQRRHRYTYAYREHKILEKYFGELYAASSYRWPDRVRRRVKANVVDGLIRLSQVSQHLVTAYTLRQAMWFFCLAIIGLLAAGWCLGRRL